MSGRDDHPFLQAGPQGSTKWIKGKLASSILGVSGSCLRNWANNGKIQCVRSPGGIRLYDTLSVTALSATDTAAAAGVRDSRVDLAYCRVSSAKQRADLARQAEHLRRRCQAAGKAVEVVQDVGSGLNFKRRGLRSLLARCLDGGVRSVTVASRDRLCRFGFELLEWLVVERCGVGL
eukprot:6021180-Prymnesium_polylepis.3